MKQAALILAITLLCSDAVAGPASPVRVAAAVPGADGKVTGAVLIGSSGELYRPDPEGLTWSRSELGGLAVAVRGALPGANGAVVAAGNATPLFEFTAGAWSVRPLPNRGSLAVAGAGSAPALAIGRHVYTRRSNRWVRRVAHKRNIVALWLGDANRIYVSDETGQLARYSRGWKPVQHSLAADDRVVELAGAPGVELYARAHSGALLWIRTSGATAVKLPADLQGLEPIVMAPATEGGVWLLANATANGAVSPVLARIHKGALTVAETLPAPGNDVYRVLLADGDGNLLVATHRGEVRLRDAAGAWRQGQVSGKLPASATKRFDGAAPAPAK